MRKCLFAILLFVTPAAAQQQPQPTAVDRVAVSLGQCIGELEKRGDLNVDLQKKLDAALAEIATLKKAEPKQ